MAQTAKQYTDLTKTTSINSSDLVAVAQSDKTELQATTVSDLASAVGELNQTGALAELSLATSIGKNLLAQRLNEKGVQNITPNNTLIEMADAVDKLPTVDGIDIITTDIVDTDGASTTLANASMPCNYCKYFARKNVFVSILNGVFRIYRYNFQIKAMEKLAEYDNSAYITTVNTSVGMQDFCLTKNNKYIGYIDFDNYYTTVLEMDWETNTLSLKHNYTLTDVVLNYKNGKGGAWASGGYNNFIGCILSEQGDSAFMASGGYDTTRMYYIDYTTNTHKKATDLPGSKTNGGNDWELPIEMHYDSQLKKITLVNKNIFIKTFTVDVSVDNPVITPDELVVPQNILDITNFTSNPSVDWDNNILFAAGSTRTDYTGENSTYMVSYDMNSIQIVAYDLTTKTILDKLSFTYALPLPSTYRSTGDLLNTRAVVVLTYNKSANNYIICPNACIRVKFDSVTKKFTVFNRNKALYNNTYVSTTIVSSISNYSSQILTIPDEEAKQLIFVRQDSSSLSDVEDGSFSSSKQILTNTFEDTSAVIGYIFTVNQIQTLLLNVHFSRSLYKAGAYDLATAQVEIPADSEATK